MNAANCVPCQRIDPVGFNCNLCGQENGWVARSSVHLYKWCGQEDDGVSQKGSEDDLTGIK